MALEWPREVAQIAVYSSGSSIVSSSLSLDRVESRLLDSLPGTSRRVELFTPVVGSLKSALADMLGSKDLERGLLAIAELKTKEILGMSTVSQNLEIKQQTKVHIIWGVNKPKKHNFSY